MILSGAMDNFESFGRHQKWSVGDCQKIKDVARELGLEDADFSDCGSYLYDTCWGSYDDLTPEERLEITLPNHFVNERQGKMRIHPTMIVAIKRFTSSNDRGPEPYPFHRHHYELTHWKNPGTESPKHYFNKNRVQCPESFVMVAKGKECPYCGEVHN